MTETIEDYKKRLMGYVQGRDPLEIMEMTVPRIEALVRSASSEKLQKKEEGKWSAAQILAHYAEGEMVSSFRLRMILGDNGTDIKAYDQNHWVANAGYLIAKPELALEVFKVLRNANLELLQSLRREQWENYGIHSERGKESVSDLVRMISGHDLNHLSQFERLMKS